MKLPLRKCEFAADAKPVPGGVRRLATDAAPSGLFGRAAFERDVLERAPRRPAWWSDAGERDWRYRAWAYAEAAGLMAQLGRLDLGEAGEEVAGQVRALARTLAEDAAWAEAGPVRRDPQTDNNNGRLHAA